MMKSAVLAGILCLGICSSLHADGPAVSGTSTNSMETTEPLEYPRVIDPGHALWRACVNTCTFWLEVPRELYLEVNRYPAFGLITGSMRGAFMGTARASLSVIDFAMFGFTGPSMYDPVIFPECIWDARWSAYGPRTPAEAREMGELERQFQYRNAIKEDMERAL